MANLNTTLRNAVASRVTQNLNVLEILDTNGTTVLVSFTGLVWGSPSNGVISVTQAEGAVLPVEKAAAASGTATTARLKHSGASGEEIVGLTCGATGSGSNVELANTNIASGQPVRLQSIQLTQSNQVT